MASDQTVKENEPEMESDPPKPVLEAYDALMRHRAFEGLRALKGKMHLDIDIDELRGRHC